MNTGMKEAMRRLAEMTAELEDRAKKEDRVISFIDMPLLWRREFTTILKHNMEFWRKMACLENMVSAFYMIDDLNEVQDVCKAMEELEATGKHSYFDNKESSK